MRLRESRNGRLIVRLFHVQSFRGEFDLRRLVCQQNVELPMNGLLKESGDGRGIVAEIECGIQELHPLSWIVGTMKMYLRCRAECLFRSIPRAFPTGHSRFSDRIQVLQNDIVLSEEVRKLSLQKRIQPEIRIADNIQDIVQMKLCFDKCLKLPAPYAVEQCADFLSMQPLTEVQSSAVDSSSRPTGVWKIDELSIEK
jgi:hypothetical protein